MSGERVIPQVDKVSKDMTDDAQIKLNKMIKGYIFSTRFECEFTSSPLVSSVHLHLLHSFRVCIYIFSTRFEC